MKGLVKKLIVYSFLIAVVLTLGVSLTGSKKTFAIGNETTYDSFFDATFIADYEFNGEDNQFLYSGKVANAAAFNNNDAFLVNSDKKILVTLGMGYSDNITNLVQTIKVNNTTFDINHTAILNEYGLFVNYGCDLVNRDNNERSNAAFVLVIDPSSLSDISDFIYGKYEIEFSFVYTDDEEVQTQVNLTRSFYVLNKSDYASNVIFANYNTVGSSDYYSNYSKNNLMYFRYNYKYINITISRLYQGLTTVTTLKNINGEFTVSSTNELGNSTNKRNVVISRSSDFDNDNIIYVTFNDVGTYYISYEYINPSLQNDVITKFYYDTLKSTDTAYVFGYQAYYTTQNELTEFKSVDQDAPYIIRKKSNSADITWYIEASIINAFDDGYISSVDDIAKTNQAPVYFQTNARINVENSEYYYFENPTIFFNYNTENYSTIPAYSQGEQAYKVTNYTGSSLSNTGVYLVQLAYTFNSENPYYQYFLFRLTDDAPEVKVFTIEKDGGGNIIYENDIPKQKALVKNESYTFEDICITKSSLGIFDSASTLSVYKDDGFNGTYRFSTILRDDNYIVITDTAKYKLVLTYGNSDKKGFTSYFTIDKTEITGIQTSNVYKGVGSNYYGNSIIENGKTSSPFVVYWNEKASGAKITLEYKYFPTRFSSISSYSSSALGTMYNSEQNKYSIPSTYTFTYNGGEVPTIEYTNTKNKVVYSENDILSEGGLYIFYIYDETGAEGKYFAVFMDNTPNSIVSYSQNIYTITNNNEMTSIDTTLFFGKYKLIKFNYDNISNYDEWLVNYLNDSNSTTYQGSTYLKILIEKTVYIEINSDTVLSYTLADGNNYGYAINSELSEGVYNENQYSFYSICETTNTYDPVYARNTYNYYKNNYTQTHSITFSTDNSRMIVYYNDGSRSKFLTQAPAVLSDNENIKYTYYQPTAKNTLGSLEILKLSYNTMPSDELIVESIIVNYYPFEKDAETGTYTFNLETPGAVIEVYKKGLSNKGTSIVGSSYTFEYTINVEQYNGSLTRTAAGRYEVIREYTSNSIIPVNDPLYRKLVFIVDRNGIISEPDTDQNGNSIYYTGSAISLQIINNFGSTYDNPETLHFYDIYFASKLSKETLTPVLKTNLLPVTVYIPSYKYGYNTINAQHYPYFNIKEQIVNYTYGGAEENYLSYYKLSAYVEYFPRENSPSTQTYVYDSVLSNYQYLTTRGNENSIISYNQEGYYRVTITSGAGDSFSFVFQIEYSKPEFNLLDVENSPLNTDNNGTVYYTNKDKIRIAWENSPSEYLATINQDHITYTINGYSNVIDTQINPVLSNGDNKYYIDLDLDNIGAYTDGCEINITLQFNGREEDYNNNDYFSKTVKLVVDLQAPVSNVTNLVSTTGLSFYGLRTYIEGKKYNTSLTSGLMRYYSFTVDKSNFENYIKTPINATYDYYKLYYRIFEKTGNNTKYVPGNALETDITVRDLSDRVFTQVFADSGVLTFNGILGNVNKYIEIIEEDYAGNRTVYTIYLTDITNEENIDKTVLTYFSSLSDSSNIINHEQEITNSDILDNNGELDLYSKYSFNLNSLDLLKNANISSLTWSIISVNNVLYVKSPFTDDLYYNYNNYAEGRENEAYTLDELTTLKHSSNVQMVKIYSSPVVNVIQLRVYVLNQVLDIYTTSQVYGENREGIIIRIPNSLNGNVLYAQSVSVRANISGSSVDYISIEGSNSRFIREEQPAISVSGLDISYITYRTGRYVQLDITRNLSMNDYFVYTIYDNYGEIYRIVHIYGQTQITNPITSEGNIVKSYNEEGKIIYYSSENIKYRFDTTIYSRANIEVIENNGYSSVTNTLSIVKTLNSFRVEYSDEYEYTKDINVSIVNNILTIQMLQKGYDFNTKLLGGSKVFIVTLVANQDFDIDDEVTNFEIYNELPSSISFIGKQSSIDVTLILEGNTAYTDAVIINYTPTELKFDFELIVMYPNGDIVTLVDGMEIESDGTYRLIINYLGDLLGCSKVFEFTIANSSKFTYSIVKRSDDGTYKEIKATGSSFSYTTNGITYSIPTHYIVNGDFDIITNSNLRLSKTLENERPINGYTYIYRISNLEEQGNLITEYFSIRIAITKLPSTNNVLRELNVYGSNVKGATGNLLNIASPVITPYVTTKEEYNGGTRISWSKYSVIPENTVSINVYYGDIDGAPYIPEIITSGNTNSVILKTSGTYYISFTDVAGNTQLFGTYNDIKYFTVRYLSSVIFEVNNEAPINYAIYDSKVTVSVPDITAVYYDVNAKPKLNVEFNGSEYTKYTKESNNVWSFTEPGIYKVSFSAKIDEKAIYEAPIYFTILSSRESRLGFNYNGYGKYYIQDILKDGVSVNKKLANINSGDMYGEYLRTISLHTNDYKTGTGYWTLVINTNNEFNQTFQFTVWVNRARIPLDISIANGETTTNNIIVKFNTYNLLTEAGDCILRISGKKDLVLTNELLESGKIDNTYELTLDETRGYYIEVTSLSGQLLYTSYVVKAEPLNAISIILITVASLVFISGVVVFVIMRKRMKVR